MCNFQPESLWSLYWLRTCHSSGCKYYTTSSTLFPAIRRIWRQIYTQICTAHVVKGEELSDETTETDEMTSSWRTILDKVSLFVLVTILYLASNMVVDEWYYWWHSTKDKEDARFGYPWHLWDMRWIKQRVARAPYAHFSQEVQRVQIVFHSAAAAQTS